MKKSLIIVIVLICSAWAGYPDCTGCFAPSSGPCKVASGVCYPLTEAGICPPNTNACGDSTTTYACTSGTCAESATGTYTDLSTCQASCTAPATKYACNGGSCAESSTGSYASLSDCQSACSSPPATKYACSGGSCAESSSGSYDSLSACQSACSSPPATKYACSSGSCSEDASGNYGSLSDCQSACQAPPATKYACNGGSCSISSSGTFSSKSACETGCSSGGTEKIVNVYQMILNKGLLDDFLKELSDAGNQATFNRISLSFIQPSIHKYQTGSLACTGIMGYYCDNRATGLQSKLESQMQNGTDDFNSLKAGVTKMKEAGLSVYLSVGGWDYNCKIDTYCETLKYYNKSSVIQCDPPNYSYVCEPKGQNQDFDYFPDPADESWAHDAYANVVKLAEDLGCEGIDLDYEEFWHADVNRRDWKQTDFITAVRQQSWNTTADGDTPAAKMQNYFDSLTYADMVDQFAAGSPNNDPNASGPFILPDTVDKLHRIIQSLETAGPNMKFTFAGPAVGALPIMVPQYGDSNSLTKGGVWWGGNLKGLLYSLVHKYGVQALENWGMGMMTYDLGCKPKNDCGTGLPFGCTLQEQVAFYATSYITYMKSSRSELETETQLEEGLEADVKDVLPHYYDVPGMTTYFGYEIGHPAYPAYDDSWKKMILLEKDVDGMLSSIGAQHDGVIIWEMFKPVSGTWDDEASTKYAASAACKYYKAGANCDSNMPYPPTSSIEDMINKWFLV